MRRSALIAGAVAAFTSPPYVVRSQSLTKIRLVGAQTQLVAEYTKFPVELIHKIARGSGAVSSDPRLIQPAIEAVAKYEYIPRNFSPKELYFVGLPGGRPYYVASLSRNGKRSARAFAAISSASSSCRRAMS